MSYGRPGDVKECQILTSPGRWNLTSQDDGHTQQTPDVSGCQRMSHFGQVYVIF